MKKIVVISVICLICLGITSCMTSREFTDVAATMRTHLSPARVNTVFKIRLGPVMVFTASTIMKIVADTEVAEYVQEIRKLQIGVYKVEPSRTFSQFAIPREVEKYLLDLGWEQCVRVREAEEFVSVFYKQRNEHVVSVYFIVLEDDELVIAEVQGRLGNVIQKVIRNIDSQITSI